MREKELTVLGSSWCGAIRGTHPTYEAFWLKTETTTNKKTNMRLIKFPDLTSSLQEV